MRPNHYPMKTTADHIQTPIGESQLIKKTWSLPTVVLISHNRVTGGGPFTAHLEHTFFHGTKHKVTTSQGATEYADPAVYNAFHS